MEVFDGDLLNFKYFASIFQEVVETKLEVQRDKLSSIHKLRLLWNRGGGSLKANKNKQGEVGLCLSVCPLY